MNVKLKKILVISTIVTFVGLLANPVYAADLTVTLNSQGGSGVAASVPATTETALANPGSPTFPGYTFTGWFTLPVGGTVATFPYTHNQLANFTLYAQWSANTLTVTLNPQGGSPVADTATATTGSVMVDLWTPTRLGYTFTGWFTSPTDGTMVSFPYTHNQVANFTLYSQWSADALTVTLNSQVGSGVAVSVETTSGSDLVNPGSPTRPGYTFMGWFSSPTSGNLISFPYTHNQLGDFTIYAQWQAMPGVIHVVNIVANDNLGIKTAADFQFTVKHFGTNVEGSPFNITDNDGKYFTLEPGTYVVAAESVDGYLGEWSGVGIENGFIDLQPGQVVTIIRNSYDIGVAVPVIPVVEPTVDPITEDGGTLPVTGTNWFNALALGLLLSAAGTLAFRKSSLTR